jgi:hypothetical protein
MRCREWFGLMRDAETGPTGSLESMGAVEDHTDERAQRVPDIRQPLIAGELRGSDVHRLARAD